MIMMMVIIMTMMIIIILLVHVRVWQDGGTRRPNGELIYKPLERESHSIVIIFESFNQTSDNRLERK